VGFTPRVGSIPTSGTTIINDLRESEATANGTEDALLSLNIPNGVWMSVTARARQALNDCEQAIADFEDSPNTHFSGPVGSRMTLLKTVHYALFEVDRSLATPECKAASMPRGSH
jgi:hypothetical protein